MCWIELAQNMDQQWDCTNSIVVLLIENIWNVQQCKLLTEMSVCFLHSLIRSPFFFLLFHINLTIWKKVHPVNFVNFSFIFRGGYYLLDIVRTVYHLVICMQSNKIHSVFLMSEFYSALMLARHVSDLIGPSSGAFLTSCMCRFGMWYYCAYYSPRPAVTFVTAGRVE